MKLFSKYKERYIPNIKNEVKYICNVVSDLNIVYLYNYNLKMIQISGMNFINNLFAM